MRYVKLPVEELEKMRFKSEAYGFWRGYKQACELHGLHEGEVIGLIDSWLGFGGRSVICIRVNQRPLSSTRYVKTFDEEFLDWNYGEDCVWEVSEE